MKKLEITAATLTDGNVVAWFEDIGPARAEELLKTYKVDYRKYRASYADGLARDMRVDPETGKSHWNFDGSPVRIDVENNLFDGQHRLNAIKLSDTTHRFLMVSGLPVEAYHTTDTGLARTYGDLLRMRGYANVQLRTAILKLISRWERGVSLDEGKRMTHAELDDLNDRHISEVNRAIEQFYSVRYRIPATPAVVAFLWWLFRSIDVEKATEFMVGVAETENLKHGHPAYTLSKRLIHDMEVHHTRMEYVEMFIRAWNAFIQGNEQYYRISVPTYLTRERMATPLVSASVS
jgi:hypothetical protein